MKHLDFSCKVCELNKPKTAQLKEKFNEIGYMSKIDEYKQFSNVADVQKRNNEDYFAARKNKNLITYTSLNLMALNTMAGSVSKYLQILILCEGKILCYFVICEENYVKAICSICERKKAVIESEQFF